MCGIINNQIKKEGSRGWFRSIDLWVMGPALFHCATLLTAVKGLLLAINSGQFRNRTMCRFWLLLHTRSVLHKNYINASEFCVVILFACINMCIKKVKIKVAEDGFDPSTSGLWAQHASAAPLCSQRYSLLYFAFNSGQLYERSCFALVVVVYSKRSA